MSEANQNEKLASAPGTINLGGRTLLISKWTPADLYAAQDYARQAVRKSYNPFQEVAAAIDGLDLKEELRAQLYLQAHRVKVSGQIPDEAVDDFLKTCEGLAFQIFLLTRRNEPGLALESIRAWIGEGNRVDVFCALDEASGANLIARATADHPFFQSASSPAKAGSGSGVTDQSAQSFIRTSAGSGSLLEQ